MIDALVSEQDIVAAGNRIRPIAHKTPVLASESINRLAGCNIHFKCENFQRSGSFKFRGACNAVALLRSREQIGVVATHSSGNHGAALALAAAIHGLKAYVVMPESALMIKRKAVQDYGAQVILCEPSMDSRERTLEELRERTGAYFIPPYNHPWIIAGQATAATELIAAEPDIDCLLTPLGGGGLLSGSALAARYSGRDIEVMGAEPSGADDAFRSMADNRIYPSINPQTICDGLLTSLGDVTFPIIRDNVHAILTVDDGTVIEAMKLIWTRMKIVVEPSSAIALAAVLCNRTKFHGRNVGVILSGGNIEPAKALKLFLQG